MNQMKTNTIRFNRWDCRIQRGQYSNGRIAFQLIDARDGIPVATATVNIPDYDLPVGHVLIKNWSENSGILETLCKAEIISPPINQVPTGFVHALECKLKPDNLSRYE